MDDVVLDEENKDEGGASPQSHVHMIVGSSTSRAFCHMTVIIEVVHRFLIKDRPFPKLGSQPGCALFFGSFHAYGGVIPYQRSNNRKWRDDILGFSPEGCRNPRLDIYKGTRGSPLGPSPEFPPSQTVYSCTLSCTTLVPWFAV